MWNLELLHPYWTYKGSHSIDDDRKKYGKNLSIMNYNIPWNNHYLDLWFTSWIVNFVTIKSTHLSNPASTSLCSAKNSSDEGDAIGLLADNPYPDHLGNIGCIYFPLALFVQEHKDTPCRVSYYGYSVFALTSFWSCIYLAWPHHLLLLCLHNFNPKYFTYGTTPHSCNSYLFPTLKSMLKAVCNFNENSGYRYTSNQHGIEFCSTILWERNIKTWSN